MLTRTPQEPGRPANHPSAPGGALAQSRRIVEGNRTRHVRVSLASRQFFRLAHADHVYIRDDGSESLR